MGSTERPSSAKNRPTHAIVAPGAGEVATFGMVSGGGDDATRAVGVPAPQLAAEAPRADAAASATTMRTTFMSRV